MTLQHLTSPSAGRHPIIFTSVPAQKRAGHSSVASFLPFFFWRTLPLRTRLLYHGGRIVFFPFPSDDFKLAPCCLNPPNKPAISLCTWLPKRPTHCLPAFLHHNAPIAPLDRTVAFRERRSCLFPHILAAFRPWPRFRLPVTPALPSGVLCTSVAVPQRLYKSPLPLPLPLSFVKPDF